MKYYPLILSRTFPQWHPRKGEPTYFANKVLYAGVSMVNYPDMRMPIWIEPREKLHTIRGNYERWARIFEKIDCGEARLELRQWSGVPYRSKQETIAVLTKEDGIGLQKLEFENLNSTISNLSARWSSAVVRGTDVSKRMLAQNDGLSYDDWRAWFKDADLSKPMAIIHFTKFRY